jgi:hypothetical protein
VATLIGLLCNRSHEQSKECFATLERSDQVATTDAHRQFRVLREGGSKSFSLILIECKAPTCQYVLDRSTIAHKHSFSMDSIWIPAAPTRVFLKLPVTASLLPVRHGLLL